jgi:hypothetical protein
MTEISTKVSQWKVPGGSWNLGGPVTRQSSRRGIAAKIATTQDEIAAIDYLPPP